MPISFVRCANVYDSTPYSPEMLSASAIVLRSVPMYDAARSGNICSCTISSIRSTSNATGSGLMR